MAELEQGSREREREKDRERKWERERDLDSSQGCSETQKYNNINNGIKGDIERKERLII